MGIPSRAKSGLLSNTWRLIVQGDTRADKARDFNGKGCPGGEQWGKGTQEDCSASGLAVLGFMVMRLVSGLPLANHSDSGLFPVMLASLSQDGFQQEGFWEIGRTYGLSSLSSSDLSQMFPVGGCLLVLSSLPGLPILR